MSLCDGHCRFCIYASVLSNNSVICQYLLVTGNRRGCEAGEGCERYIKGVRLSTIDNSIFRGAPPPPPKPKKPRDREEERRKYMEKTQAMCQGRQQAAILEFCKETGWNYTQIAKALGVSQTAVSYWAKERSPANWTLLAKLGIKKPELPGEVSA